MEFKMMNQFENIKMAENTQFFSDPVSIELGKGIVLLDKLNEELNKNPNIVNPCLIINNNSIFLKGSIPWSEEKISEFQKVEELEKAKFSGKIQQEDLMQLQKLLSKYPREALKFLSEQ